MCLNQKSCDSGPEGKLIMVDNNELIPTIGHAATTIVSPCENMCIQQKNSFPPKTVSNRL